ncbi:MAG TPA: PAS domain S-box protein [Nitrospirota bacterium]|nr:PAS domain S-box protein [Nitrospirota bacterium]
MKDKSKSSHKKSTRSGGARRTVSGSNASGPATRSAKPAEPQQIEARFRAVFENSRDAIGVSKAGVHLFENPAYLELFGFPRGASLAGKPVLDRIAPGNRDQVREYTLSRARGESAPSAYETRGLRIDGSEFDMEVSVSTYREDGEDRTLAILRDITRRKTAENEIAERGAMLQQIMDTASVAIGWLDKSGRITHANRRMAEMFGRTMEELIGSEYVDLVHPAERESGRKNMLALLASKIPSVDLERLYRRKDGTEFWGHLACRRFHDARGNELGLIGVITDISTRKRAEEALRNSERRLNTILDNVGAYIFIKDTQYRYTYVNRKVCDLFGKKAEEILGKGDAAFFSAASVEEIMRSDRLVIERGETVAREETGLASSDEQPRTYWTVKLPLRDSRGTISALCGISTDITERKLTEEVLRQSENRTRSIVESLPIGMHLYHLEPDGRLVFIGANPAADGILGVDNSIFIGKTIEEAFPALKDTEVPRRYRETAATGTAWQTESIAYHEGDIRGAFEVHAFRTAPNTMAAAFEDITARKRSESALMRSEEKYRRLYNETPVLLHSIDRDGVVVDVNDHWLKTLGYERQEVIGRKVTDFLTDASRKYSLEVVQPAFFRDGAVQDVSFQMVKKNGDVADVLLSATAERDASGSVVRSLAVIQDITERKRAEEALRENQARLDLALQSAHMGVWRWEIKENRRYMDNLTCQLLGIEAATFSGTEAEFFRAVHPEDHEKIKASLARTIEQNVHYESAFRVIWPEGSVHYVTARGRLVRDDKGQPVRINGIVWDTTDQRLLEDERLKTQKIESIGTLAGGIAHDFNNLLQGVFGFISMAKLTFDQREKSLAMLEQAEKALHASVNLTNQLLTFSKGGKPLKKVIELRPVIENAVRLALSGSHNDYTLSIDEGLNPVEADAGQIGQVIQNIVLNADQAMPLGGTIALSARNAPATDGSLVEILISDQGTGIPQDHLLRIFDPYFTTKEKGSGLGLATSYSIIKNHGGEINVASELGKGSTFTIHLPASERAAEAPPLPATPVRSRRGRVLVMDDEEVIRMVTRELLHELGHEAVFVENGEAALKAYREAKASGRPFDVVILDLTIRGGMGGMETMRKLREIDPEVRAVVSSGYSDDSAIASHREQGFKAFLKKPYNVKELRDALNALLE